MLWISSEISLVDCADFSASLRTSSATTANPRPCSPARAASMAAFRASRLVCSARSSITSMILPMSSARCPSAPMISPEELMVVLIRFSQSLNHLGEGIAQGVVRGAWLHFEGQIASGNGFRDRRHFLKVGDHLVEGACQFADLIGAGQINVVLQIAGIADGASHIHQVG